MKHTDHFHGSDLEKIERTYQVKKEELISFSANVNPFGLSNKLRATLSDRLDVITSYPDREYTALRAAIGNYCDTDPDNIIVGNGSTELISLFIQLKHPKKALILGPTYSEYEREIKIDLAQIRPTVAFPHLPENTKTIDEIKLLANDNHFTLYEREFLTSDIEKVFMVVCATNDRELNHTIGNLAKSLGLFVSVSDCKEECNFYFPAIAENSSTIVGIVGDGNNHHAVSQIAKKIRELERFYET